MLSSTGALRGDASLFSRGTGGASADTIFAFASFSKVIVATVALRVAERGADSVASFLDADVGPSVPSLRLKRPCTLRRLLTHTSGLCDDEAALSVGPWRTAGRDFGGGGEGLLASCAGLLAESPWQPLAAAAADGSYPYAYSNMGFTLAAAVLEARTGTAFARLAQELVFAPLGMARSSFLLEETLKMPPLPSPTAHAAGAASVDDASLPPSGADSVAIPHGPGGAPAAIGHYGTAQYPAAGLRTTLADMFSFLRIVLRESSGAAKLLPLGGAAAAGSPSLAAAPEVVAPFLSPTSWSEMFPPSGDHGLAWWGADATFGEGPPPAGSGCIVWSHGGFMDGVRSHVFVWPAAAVALVHVQNWQGGYEKVISSARREISALTGLGADEHLRTTTFD